jgi:hypothetical protein
VLNKTQKSKALPRPRASGEALCRQSAELR